MENQPMSFRELLRDTHVGLERQGPGSPDMTLKALSFVDGLKEGARVADLGCGTGGQTMVLAQKIEGKITGLDFFPEFIKIFHENARKRKLQDRAHGIVGNMENLPFQKEELDLIWSEGAIDSIGFEKGLTHWHGFLKKGGHVAVTSATWFTEERPAEIEKWWVEAVPDMDTIGQNITILQKAGYHMVAVFALPEQCWTERYFIPREAAGKALLEKYAGNQAVKDYVESDRHEAELYEKYKQYYGYVFYIGKKL